MRKTIKDSKTGCPLITCTHFLDRWWDNWIADTGTVDISRGLYADTYNLYEDQKSIHTSKQEKRGMNNYAQRHGYKIQAVTVTKHLLDNLTIQL